MGLDFCGKNITMKNKSPDSGDVLEHLSPLIPQIFDKLESGISLGRQFFDEGAYPFDHHLFAHLVRYHARRLLQEEGQIVRYLQGELTNSGLFLTYGFYGVRILRGKDGQLPPPQTRSRFQFYNQVRQLELFSPSDPLGFVEDKVDEHLSDSLPLNLVILWRITKKFNLELTLVCPKVVDRDGHVAIFWTLPIPHPALGVPSSEDARFIEEELDISLPGLANADQEHLFSTNANVIMLDEDEELDITLPLMRDVANESTDD
jgi:hypothetical protein